MQINAQSAMMIIVVVFSVIGYFRHHNLAAAMTAGINAAAFFVTGWMAIATAGLVAPPDLGPTLQVFTLIAFMVTNFFAGVALYASLLGNDAEPPAAVPLAPDSPPFNTNYGAQAVGVFLYVAVLVRAMDSAQLSEALRAQVDTVRQGRWANLIAMATGVVVFALFAIGLVALFT